MLESYSILPKAAFKPKFSQPASKAPKHQPLAGRGHTHSTMCAPCLSTLSRLACMARRLPLSSAQRINERPTPLPRASCVTAMNSMRHSSGCKRDGRALVTVIKKRELSADGALPGWSAKGVVMCKQNRLPCCPLGMCATHCCSCLPAAQKPLSFKPTVLPNVL